MAADGLPCFTIFQSPEALSVMSLSRILTSHGKPWKLAEGISIDGGMSCLWIESCLRIRGAERPMTLGKPDNHAKDIRKNNRYDFSVRGFIV